MDNYINKVIEQMQENCESHTNIEWVKSILTEMSQLSFEAGQQSQQAKVEKLQKRVDSALNLTSKWRSFKRREFMGDWGVGAEHARGLCSDELEQALKGEA